MTDTLARGLQYALYSRVDLKDSAMFRGWSIKPWLFSIGFSIQAGHRLLKAISNISIFHVYDTFSLHTALPISGQTIQTLGQLMEGHRRKKAAICKARREALAPGVGSLDLGLLAIGFWENDFAVVWANYGMLLFRA